MGRLLTTRQYGSKHIAIMKPSLDGNGYYRTMMDGHTIKVHRIVGENWLENPLNLPVINHINCDRTDNRVENLEWATKKYNAWYGVKQGSITPPLDPRKQTTKEQSRKIYNRYQELLNGRVRLKNGEQQKIIATIRKEMGLRISDYQIYRHGSGTLKCWKQNLTIPSVCEKHHTHIVSDENIVL